MAINPKRADFYRRRREETKEKQRRRGKERDKTAPTRDTPEPVAAKQEVVDQAANAPESTPETKPQTIRQVASDRAAPSAGRSSTPTSDSTPAVPNATAVAAALDLAQSKVPSRTPQSVKPTADSIDQPDARIVRARERDVERRSAVLVDNEVSKPDKLAPYDDERRLRAERRAESSVAPANAPVESSVSPVDEGSAAAVSRIDFGSDEFARRGLSPDMLRRGSVEDVGKVAPKLAQAIGALSVVERDTMVRAMEGARRGGIELDPEEIGERLIKARAEGNAIGQAVDTGDIMRLYVSDLLPHARPIFEPSTGVSPVDVDEYVRGEKDGDAAQAYDLERPPHARPIFEPSTGVSPVDVDEYVRGEKDGDAAQAYDLERPPHARPIFEPSTGVSPVDVDEYVRGEKDGDAAQAYDLERPPHARPIFEPSTGVSPVDVDEYVRGEKDGDAAQAYDLERPPHARPIFEPSTGVSPVDVDEYVRGEKDGDAAQAYDLERPPHARPIFEPSTGVSPVDVDEYVRGEKDGDAAQAYDLERPPHARPIFEPSTGVSPVDVDEYVRGEKDGDAAQAYDLERPPHARPIFVDVSDTPPESLAVSVTSDGEVTQGDGSEVAAVGADGAVVTTTEQAVAGSEEAVADGSAEGATVASGEQTETTAPAATLVDSEPEGLVTDISGESEQQSDTTSADPPADRQTIDETEIQTEIDQLRAATQADMERYGTEYDYYTRHSNNVAQRQVQISRLQSILLKEEEEQEYYDLVDSLDSAHGEEYETLAKTIAAKHDDITSDHPRHFEYQRNDDGTSATEESRYGVVVRLLNDEAHVSAESRNNTEKVIGFDGDGIAYVRSNGNGPLRPLNDIRDGATNRNIIGWAPDGTAILANFAKGQFDVASKSELRARQAQRENREAANEVGMRALQHFRETGETQWQGAGGSTQQAATDKASEEADIQQRQDDYDAQRAAQADVNAAAVAAALEQAQSKPEPTPEPVVPAAPATQSTGVFEQDIESGNVQSVRLSVAAAEEAQKEAERQRIAGAARLKAAQDAQDEQGYDENESSDLGREFTEADKKAAEGLDVDIIYHDDAAQRTAARLKAAQDAQDEQGYDENESSDLGREFTEADKKAAEGLDVDIIYHDDAAQRTAARLKAAQDAQDEQGYDENESSDLGREFTEADKKAAEGLDVDIIYHDDEQLRLDNLSYDDRADDEVYDLPALFAAGDERIREKKAIIEAQNQEDGGFFDRLGGQLRDIKSEIVTGGDAITPTFNKDEVESRGYADIDHDDAMAFIGDESLADRNSQMEEHLGLERVEHEGKTYLMSAEEKKLFIELKSTAADADYRREHGLRNIRSLSADNIPVPGMEITDEEFDTSKLLHNERDIKLSQKRMETAFEAMRKVNYYGERGFYSPRKTKNEHEANIEKAFEGLSPAERETVLVVWEKEQLEPADVGKFIAESAPFLGNAIKFHNMEQAAMKADSPGGTEVLHSEIAPTTLDLFSAGADLVPSVAFDAGLKLAAAGLKPSARFARLVKRSVRGQVDESMHTGSDTIRIPLTGPETFDIQKTIVEQGTQGKPVDVVIGNKVYHYEPDPYGKLLAEANPDTRLAVTAGDRVKLQDGGPVPVLVGDSGYAKDAFEQATFDSPTAVKSYAEEASASGQVAEKPVLAYQPIDLFPDLAGSNVRYLTPEEKVAALRLTDPDIIAKQFTPAELDAMLNKPVVPGGAGIPNKIWKASADDAAAPPPDVRIDPYDFVGKAPKLHKGEFHASEIELYTPSPASNEAFISELEPLTQFTLAGSALKGTHVGLPASVSKPSYVRQIKGNFRTYFDERSGKQYGLYPTGDITSASDDVIANTVRRYDRTRPTAEPAPGAADLSNGLSPGHPSSALDDAADYGDGAIDDIGAVSGDLSNGLSPGHPSSALDDAAGYGDGAIDDIGAVSGDLSNGLSPGHPSSALDDAAGYGDGAIDDIGTVSGDLSNGLSPGHPASALDDAAGYGDGAIDDIGAVSGDLSNGLSPGHPASALDDAAGYGDGAIDDIGAVSGDLSNGLSPVHPASALDDTSEIARLYRLSDDELETLANEGNDLAALTLKAKKSGREIETGIDNTRRPRPIDDSSGGVSPVSGVVIKPALPDSRYDAGVDDYGDTFGYTERPVVVPPDDTRFVVRPDDGRRERPVVVPPDDTRFVVRPDDGRRERPVVVPPDDTRFVVRPDDGRRERPVVVPPDDTRFVVRPDDGRRERPVVVPPDDTRFVVRPDDGRPKTTTVTDTTGERPDTTTVPDTESRLTTVPETESRITTVPETESRITTVPETESRITTVPETESRITTVPETESRITTVPETESRITTVPETESRITTVPETESRITTVPETESRITTVPETESRITTVPETESRITTVPETESRITTVPETESRITTVPETESRITTVPETETTTTTVPETETTTTTVPGGGTTPPDKTTRARQDDDGGSREDRQPDSNARYPARIQWFKDDQIHELDLHTNQLTSKFALHDATPSHETVRVTQYTEAAPVERFVELGEVDVKVGANGISYVKVSDLQADAQSNIPAVELNLDMIEDTSLNVNLKPQAAIMDVNLADGLFTPQVAPQPKRRGSVKPSVRSNAKKVQPPARRRSATGKHPFLSRGEQRRI